MDQTEAYTAWLSNYTEKLKQMDSLERSFEQRNDYHEECQAEVDYLDYVEEWLWHAETKARETISRFIAQASKRHIKIKCKGGHTHQLTTVNQPEAGDTIVDDPSQIIYQQCWYTHLAETGNKAIQHLKRPNVQLPDPIEHMMTRIIQLKLAVDGITPLLLPMDIFQSVWWTGEDRTSVAKALMKAMNPTAKRELLTQKARAVPQIQSKEILLDFPDSDHGMHVLQDQLSESDFNEIVTFTNKLRTRIDIKARRISLESLAERRLICKFCKEGVSGGLSIFGIYYAPPGCGKTTSQEEGILVGYDTDWIGVGATWLDYGTLLRKRIPIITNQPEVFIGSGVKILGIVRSDIRRGADGKPLDNPDRLMSWAKSQSRNVYFIRTQLYLSDFATTLQILAVMQQTIANHCINLLPFYKDQQDPEWAKRFAKMLRRKEAELTLEKSSSLI